MKLKIGTFAGMANDILSQENKIVIFGTGVIGTTVTPEILKMYGLEALIECCIDNDKTKWDTKIEMCGREVQICNPSVLKTLSSNITVLVTISRYYSALEQLKQLDTTGDMSCYIIPMMFVENYHSKGGKGIIKTSENQIIPKKIHYIWLGGKPMPDKLMRCIDSWRKHCPDYEIIRWDESNYDVYKNKFTTQAYDNKMFAFVPDYARFDLLYNHGGIYMDTDVELIRNIDELLYQEAFCGVEKWQVLNFGGCSGAMKGHPSLELFLEKWQNRSLIRTDGSLDTISSGLIDTAVALSAGYKINGENQSINGMNIYSYDYFHPYDYMSGILDMTSDTYSIHHFQGGWLDDASRSDSRKATEVYKQLLQSAIIV